MSRDTSADTVSAADAQVTGAAARSPVTLSEQARREAWGKEWGQVSSEAAKTVKEGT